jgi:hypothetical protein
MSQDQNSQYDQQHCVDEDHDNDVQVQAVLVLVEISVRRDEVPC